MSFISEIFAGFTVWLCGESRLLCLYMPGDNETSHKKRCRLAVVLVLFFL